MTDDLERHRVLGRLDAHAGRHPELVDHDDADPEEWLAVLERALLEEVEPAPPSLQGSASECEPACQNGPSQAGE